MLLTALFLFFTLAVAQSFLPVGSTIFTTSNNASIFPLLENAETPELFVMPPCGTFNLEEATIDDMQAAMASGGLTSVQLCLCYLQRTFQTQNYLK